MDDKITIIEGPPPTFELVNQEWVLSLSESPTLGAMALTRLRTFNGPALVERCYRAWRNRQPIHLEFRNSAGLNQAVPILAARVVEVEDGNMLLLWVRLNEELAAHEFGRDDESGEDDEGDIGLSNL